MINLVRDTAQPLYNPRLRIPANEFGMTLSGRDPATNTFHLSWTKKRCRVTLLDVEGAATTATLRVGKNSLLSPHIRMYFPLDGKEFENFSNIYHGSEVKREFWIEFGTGASVHVKEVSIEEWD